MNYKDFFIHLQPEKNSLEEWKNAEAQKSKTSVLKRLKDSSSSPSIGDEVKIQFEKSSRGFLTPDQKEVNGKVGTVKNRQTFKTGSQFARYTVELNNDGRRVYNLTPGEVILTSE